MSFKLNEGSRTRGHKAALVKEWLFGYDKQQCEYVENKTDSYLIRMDRTLMNNALDSHKPMPSLSTSHLELVA